MVKVIGVKFRTSGRIYYFDPLDLPIEAGDGVIVETARGLEYGDVSAAVKEIDESELIAPLKPVVRIATEEDARQRAYYASKEGEAFTVCLEKIEKHGLDMKLVDVEYTFNGSKVVFYFTADERVDFRELVKDLAYVLKTRIELRQIGVRDEAKMLGGLGSCGRPVCCKTFLDDFRPVSIKMAKEQNLSLSPTKISGLCGRLMCCLQYEQDAYDDMHKRMPKVGKEVATVDGIGTVVENNILTEKTKVRLVMEDGTIDVREYPYTHLGTPGEPLPEAARKEPVKRDSLWNTENELHFAPAAEQEPQARKRSRGRNRSAASAEANRPQEANPKQKQGEQKPKQGEPKPKQKQNEPKPKQKQGEQKQKPKQAEQKPKQGTEAKPEGTGEGAKKRNHRRRYYRPKNKQGNAPQQ